MEPEISEIILQELRDHRKESATRHEAIEQRVRHVESWQSNADGKITAFGIVGVFIGGLVTWATDLFHR